MADFVFRESVLPVYRWSSNLRRWHFSVFVSTLRERGTNEGISGEAMLLGLCELSLLGFISGLLAQPHVWFIGTLGLRAPLGLTILWLVNGLGED